MLKRLKKITYIAIMSIYLSSCISRWEQSRNQADEYYQNKIYTLSAKMYIESININQDNQKAIDSLKMVYPLAIQQYIETIQNTRNSSDNTEYKYNTIIQLYKNILNLNDSINAINKNLNQKLDIQIVDFTKQYEEVKTEVSEFYYNQGLDYMKKNDIESQKEAAINFRKSQTYIPNYKDSSQLYEISKSKGIKKIAILFEDNSGKDKNYGATSDIINDKITSKLLGNKELVEFVKITTRDELQKVLKEQSFSQTNLTDNKSSIKLGNILGADEMVIGKITQINNVTSEPIITQKIEKSFLKTGIEKSVDEQGKIIEKDVFNDVYAYSNLYTLNMKSTLSVSFKIINVSTAEIKRSESFTETSDFTNKWGVFVSGDARAISYDTRSYIDKGQLKPPSPEELLNENIDKISNQISKQIIIYYNKTLF